MRFPKSVVQVRECGIALKYILLGHLGDANAARVSANADARALLFTIVQCVRGNADGVPRPRPGVFGRAARSRKKACRCGRLSGGPDGTSLKKLEHGPRAPAGDPPAVRPGGGV